jgi:hypothetical protein
MARMMPDCDGPDATLARNAGGQGAGRRDVVERIGTETRIWAAGLVVLVADGALAAGLGLAGRPDRGDLQGPLLVLVLALALFLVPLEVGLRIPAARERWAFWLATCLEAMLWVPAVPFIFLTAGPDLASPLGLLLVGLAILGAVLVLAGGVPAAVTARRRDIDRGRTLDS